MEVYSEKMDAASTSRQDDVQVREQNNARRQATVERARRTLSTKVLSATLLTRSFLLSGRSSWPQSPRCGGAPHGHGWISRKIRDEQGCNFRGSPTLDLLTEHQPDSLPRSTIDVLA
jgi:hypothetical protein